MFALGVIGIDLNSADARYFDLVMELTYRDPNRVKHINIVPLQPCTVDQWSHFGS